MSPRSVGGLLAFALVFGAVVLYSVNWAMIRSRGRVHRGEANDIVRPGQGYPPLPRGSFSEEILARKLRTEFAAEDRESAQRILAYFDENLATFTTPKRQAGSVVTGKICAIRLSLGSVERLDAIVHRYADIRELQQLSETIIEMVAVWRRHSAGDEVTQEELRALRERGWTSFVCWLQADGPLHDPVFEDAVVALL